MISTVPVSISTPLRPSHSERALPPRKKSRSPKRKDKATHEEIAEIAKAFSHPVRVQILEYLARDTGSATTIAEGIDLPLGNVSYHLNTCLDREYGLVQVVESRQIRGASERFYRIDYSAIFKKLDWPTAPEPVRAAVGGATLLAFITDAVAAVEHGPLDARKDSTLRWTPARLDSKGWQEVQGVLSEAKDKIGRAIDESQGRLGRSGASPINAMIGLAAFEALHPWGHELAGGIP